MAPADHIHVLVVDDEPDIAELFRQKFRQEIRQGTLRFSFAEDGAQALEHVVQNPDIEIVFTDLNMPQMNGLELLKHLRDLQLPTLRTLVVSAYGDMANIRIAMNQGAMDFIIKPIDLADLGITLDKARKDVQQARAGLSARQENDRLRVEVEVSERNRRLQMEFFDNITHELRTPLTLLLGPLGLAIDEVAQEPARTRLITARRNAEHLQALVEELLESARVDAGAAQFHPVHGDLVPFVAGIHRLFEPLARARGIAFALQLPEAPLPTRHDPPKLHKILSNLLSNALKFTPEGGKVQLSLGQEGQQAHITVADDGPGIAPDDQARVFERFFRGDRPQAGTGIGLALAQGLAGLHQGRITLVSDIGQGAAFTLQLPLTPPAPDQQPPAPQALPDDLPLVLLVDDHADMRSLVQDCLGPAFRYIHASDGGQALEQAREHMPDLVITDWTMPGMDGLALLAALRADIRSSHVPVVMLTAKATHGDRIDGLRLGADAYLPKPFSPGELQATVTNLLRRIDEVRAKTRKQVLSTPEVSEAMSMDEQFLAQVRGVLQQELANERFGVEQLADALAMSRKTLHRKISALTGQAPNPFMRAFRLEAAMQMLKQQRGTVGEIAFLTGFGSHSYFSKCFQEYFNVSPSEV